MAYEWAMFNAVVSERRDKAALFDAHAMRLHLLDRSRNHESVGYIEQRRLHGGEEVRFFLTVMRGERINDQPIDDIKTGMDILDLVSRERKAEDD